MKANKISIAVLLCFVLSVFPVHPKDPGKIPAETLIPVKAVGVNDGFSFLMPWFVYYNKYDECVYVVDQKEHNILVFDRDLNYLDSIGRYGQGEIEFNYPAGIAFAPKGRLYICDVQNYRVQILDRYRNFVSSFKCRFDDYQPEICLDSKERIYMNLPSNDALVTVFDKEGNIVDKFGKITDSTNMVEKKYLNLIRMHLDEEDNIYIAFQEFPILKKYDKNFKLVYEKEYAHLPEIIEKTKGWELQKSRQKQSTHLFKLLNMNLSMDETSLYLGFFMMESNPIYTIDKKTGEILKRILLRASENNTGYYYRFDASNKDYLFGTDIQQKELHKIKKWRK